MIANNSKTNKISNRNNILKMIALNAPVSRVGLAKITGLSKMSLTNIITEFKEMNLITETGIDVTASGKRKPILLELTDGCICSVGINITRNYVEGCLADIKGNMLYTKRVEYADDMDEKKLKGMVIDLVGEIMNVSERNVVGIGISSIGSIDPKRGMILSPTNFYGIENVNIAQEVEKAFDLPVYLYKCANCAALAEKYYGAGKDINNFAFVTVSRGIGAAAVVNNQLITGTNGFSCEIGHITINPDGESCSCGNCGCLEVYANIMNTRENVARRINNGEKCSVEGKVTFEKIVTAAKSGDEVCSQELDNLCRYISVAVINTVNIFDPEVVVIGGDIAVGGSQISERIKKYVGNVPMAMKFRDVKIVMSKFYDKATILGSATAVFEETYFKD